MMRLNNANTVDFQPVVFESSPYFRPDANKICLSVLWRVSLFRPVMINNGLFSSFLPVTFVGWYFDGVVMVTNMPISPRCIATLSIPAICAISSIRRISGLEILPITFSNRSNLSPVSVSSISICFRYSSFALRWARTSLIARRLAYGRLFILTAITAISSDSRQRARCARKRRYQKSSFTRRASAEWIFFH